MNLSQIELDLYASMQDHFPKDWEMGDKVYSLNSKRLGFIVNELTYRGCLKVRWSKTSSQGQYYSDVLSKNLLCLPLPIDPGDPDRIERGERPRGLLDMLEGSKAVENWGHGYQVTIWTPNHHRQAYYGATPTEALLRALKAQAVDEWLPEPEEGK